MSSLIHCSCGAVASPDDQLLYAVNNPRKIVGCPACDHTGKPPAPAADAAPPPKAREDAPRRDE